LVYRCVEIFIRALNFSLHSKHADNVFNLHLVVELLLLNITQTSLLTNSNTIITAMLNSKCGFMSQPHIKTVNGNFTKIFLKEAITYVEYNFSFEASMFENWCYLLSLMSLQFGLFVHFETNLKNLICLFAHLVYETFQCIVA